MNAVQGLSPADTLALTRRVTIYSVATASILVAIKVAAWLATDSVALLASTADSALDLVASLTTFFAVRYAAAPPDAEHRFGHGKAEGFASLVQAGLVFASAALIGREAIGDILAPRPIQDGVWALVVMVISIVLTGLLIVAQSRVLRQTSSVAVSGDRAHYAADLASNVVALAGIGLSIGLGRPKTGCPGGADRRRDPAVGRCERVPRGVGPTDGSRIARRGPRPDCQTDD
jgi:ferrous-iron efflux pump FieF